MSIDKIDPVWASDETPGYIVAPADSKIERGWAPNEQPPNPYENFRGNRVEAKINEVIDNDNLKIDNEFFDTLYDRCSLLPSADSILHPAGASNKVSMPNDVIMCRGYDHFNKRECVFSLGRTDPTILHVIYNQFPDSDNWTYTTVSLDGLTSSDIAIDLCCDGYYLYIATNDEDTSASTISVYQFEESSQVVNPEREDYRQISGEWIFTAFDDWATNSNVGKQICVADADNLAVLDTTNHQIGIIPKNLSTAPVWGQGQLATIDLPATTVVTLAPRGICSDGTRIWAFAAVSTESGAHINDHLFAVLIADPTDVTGGVSRSAGSLYLPETSTDRIWDIIFDGRALHVLSMHYDAGAHATHDNILDLTQETWTVARYAITSGNVDSVLTRRWATCAAFTGRRVAVVTPVCPVDDLTMASLWLVCNQSQMGLALLNTDRGGYDVIGDASYEQTIEIKDDQVTCLMPMSVSVTTYHRISSVVFADSCLWVLVHRFLVADDSCDNTFLIRVPSIERR